MPGPVLTPRRPWKGRRVVLGVTGGIAAYKSVQVARDLTRLGCEVDVVLTRAATRFVTPLTFEGVTGRPALGELFSTAGAAMHVRLGAEADVVCVAPATADFLARAAHGRGDDLLTTTVLAAAGPVLVCPAMNDRMFAHPATRSNLEYLRDTLGYRVAGPAVGPLAAGEGEGPGRMIEAAEIVEQVGRELGREPAFQGRRVLVTAGPTREAVDPVRFVGNRSSGRMGFALAAAAWRRGAEVTLVTGPVALDTPPGIRRVDVESAREMHVAVAEALPEADVAVFAAAVADYRPARSADSKLKRETEGPTLDVPMVANPDIALETRALRKPGAVAVGFALETGEIVASARGKLERKGFHLVVANDASEEGAGFEVETNRVTLVDATGGVEEVPLSSKDEVAERILDRVRSLLVAGGVEPAVR